MRLLIESAAPCVQAAIAAVLGAAPSLHTLSIGDNMIGDSGAAHLVTALALSPSLTALDLSFNSITDKVCQLPA